MSARRPPLFVAAIAVNVIVKLSNRPSKKLLVSAGTSFIAVFGKIKIVQTELNYSSG